MVVELLMGHVPVKKHLNSMGLLDGNLDHRFAKWILKTVYHIICCCEVLARQYYNFFINFFVEPKDIVQPH